MNTIVIENLTKFYGKTKGIDNITLDVHEGEIYGFIGTNGAGKSTLIRTLLNLIYPTSGKATLNSLDIVNDADKIKSVVAFVPSEITFYKIKVKELFDFCLKAWQIKDKSKLDNLCKYFELDVERSIPDLSYGNRKKVSLILALIKDSKIIILDEPTNGLDPIMQDKFFKCLIEEKNKGKTIFLSSHNLNEIEKYCDRVCIIKNGVIVKIFEIKDLLFKQKHQVAYELENGEKVVEVFENINDIIKKLSKLTLKNCQIKQLSVEDELKKYYIGDYPYENK